MAGRSNTTFFFRLHIPPLGLDNDEFCCSRAIFLFRCLALWLVHSGGERNDRRIRAGQHRVISISGHHGTSWVVSWPPPSNSSFLCRCGWRRMDEVIRHHLPRPALANRRGTLLISNPDVHDLVRSHVPAVRALGLVPLPRIVSKPDRHDGILRWTAVKSSIDFFFVR